MKPHFLIPTALLVVAGCMDAPLDSGSETSNPSSESSASFPTSSVLPPPVVHAFPVPSEIFWTNCTKGMNAASDYPVALVKPNVPSSWEPQVQALIQVHVEGFECGRIGLGEYERGPVRVLFEFHDYQERPDACGLKPGQGFDQIYLNTLHSVWVDDAEIASYFRGILFMPAYYSPINVTTEAATLHTSHVWSWGLPGKPQSVLRVMEDQTPKQDRPEYDTRLFWFNETSVSYIDARMNGWSNYLTWRVANGTMYPPMLFSSLGSDYKSYGEWQGDRRLQTTIHRFRDLYCKEPIP